MTPTPPTHTSPTPTSPTPTAPTPTSPTPISPTPTSPTPTSPRRVAGLFVGLATLDLVQRVDALPGSDEKATATWQELAAGGPALNAAVVFAALGADATLVTRVGPGPLGRLVADDLRRQNVRLIDLADADYTPAVSAIAVGSGTGARQIISTDAAASTPPAPDDPRLNNLAHETVDIVLIDGHHPDLAHAVLDALTEAGTIDQTDPLGRTDTHGGTDTHGETGSLSGTDSDGLDESTGSIGRPTKPPVVLDAGRWKPPMAQLLPRCSDIICSAAFRLETPAATAGDEASGAPDALLDALLARGARFAAISNGDKPIRWRHAHETGQIEVPPTEVVDTLAAGDALHGAYAWALATRLAESTSEPVTRRPHALSAAAAIATRSTTHRGTRSWLAGLRETHHPGDSP